MVDEYVARKNVYINQVYNKLELECPLKFTGDVLCSVQDGIEADTYKTKCYEIEGCNTEYPTFKYKYIKKIGNGSASKLYKANKNDNNMEVVIKKISKRENWRTELNVLKKIKKEKLTERLLELVDFFESSLCAYIITTYYEGYDLYEYVHINTPYKEEHACEILREMLLCLKVCHDNAIAHLDIKFENYIRCLTTPTANNEKGWMLKLVDFGHAEFMDRREIKKGASYGTVYYLCPEGYNEVYSSKSDIWSIGICAHLLLTNDFPFEGANYDDEEYYVKNVYHRKLLIDQKIDDLPIMKMFIMRCLDYDIKKRATVDELLALI